MDEAGPSQGQEEEESELMEAVGELWDMKNDFSCHLGKNIVTCLLWCWDNGASRLYLMSSRARKLESLSMEGGIDKAIGNGTLAFSLLSSLLSAVKKRDPFKEELVCYPGKWATMEKGIQYQN